ncbi:hypothetical protein DM02DRAFT_696122, partial [Periconia macrospinosa]
LGLFLRFINLALLEFHLYSIKLKTKTRFNRKLPAIQSRHGVFPNNLHLFTPREKIPRLQRTLRDRARKHRHGPNAPIRPFKRLFERGLLLLVDLASMYREHLIDAILDGLYRGPVFFDVALECNASVPEFFLVVGTACAVCDGGKDIFVRWWDEIFCCLSLCALGVLDSIHFIHFV